MTSSRQSAEAFKTLMEEKIRALVGEFSEGKLSREQFHVLYERYSSRLSIATEALITNNPQAIEIAKGGPPTLAVRGAFMGRAMGLRIYHHRSRSFIESLGDFDISDSKIMPILNEFGMMIEINKLVEHRLEQKDARHWLLYNPGKYTSVVTFFANEPSQMQIREIARLHHDFEVANDVALQSETVDASKLGQPFVVFIKEKFG